MRLHCAQNIDTVLGSIVNTIRRAYVINSREQESLLWLLLTSAYLNPYFKILNLQYSVFMLLTGWDNSWFDQLAKIVYKI